LRRGLWLKANMAQSSWDPISMAGYSGMHLSSLAMQGNKNRRRIAVQAGKGINRDHTSKISNTSQAPVAHTYKPSYLEDWDQEDHGLRPAWANSLWSPISKITRARAGAVAQVVRCLPSKYEASSLNPSTTKRKKKKK
jgi:hypothetical protein